MTTDLESRVETEGPVIEVIGDLCELKDERFEGIIQKHIVRSERKARLFDRAATVIVWTLALHRPGHPGLHHLRDPLPGHRHRAQRPASYSASQRP